MLYVILRNILIDVCYVDLSTAKYNELFPMNKLENGFAHFNTIMIFVTLPHPNPYQYPRITLLMCFPL